MKELLQPACQEAQGKTRPTIYQFIGIPQFPGWFASALHGQDVLSIVSIFWGKASLNGSMGFDKIAVNTHTFRYRSLDINNAPGVQIVIIYLPVT
ncbi:MAG: hypothetical protein JEZ12_22550 [Desulfobacterium sp.]|nr:hypothetical protein [Desulfobacterium sp.]